MFKILTQFEMQQNASEIAKEFAVNYAGYNAIEHVTGDQDTGDHISEFFDNF